MDQQYLRREYDYDSLRVVENLHNMNQYLNQIVTTYEMDILELDQYDDQLQDLLHYAELADYKNVPKGYAIYRKIAEVRRERRRLLNEVDLLKPAYDWVKNTTITSTVAKIQGECSLLKKAIDGKSYKIRTGVLDDFTDLKRNA